MEKAGKKEEFAVGILLAKFSPKEMKEEKENTILDRLAMSLKWWVRIVR